MEKYKLQSALSTATKATSNMLHVSRGNAPLKTSLADLWEKFIEFKRP
ncbi:hypothetical protein NIES2104_32550 [Leptolyngbya sp. NIES-2104]|nr:hypothetical protein NIES2104_32550 [Leptolyngbya sp. NIES-2104]